MSDARPYSLELEREVENWLASLSRAHYLRVEAAADYLAENAETLDMLYSSHLGGKLRELRISLDGKRVRITYWLAPGRRIVLLTVFYKAKPREVEQIARAQLAQKACEAGHEEADTLWAR